LLEGLDSNLYILMKETSIKARFDSFILSEAFEKLRCSQKSAIRGTQMSHELINLTLPVVMKN